MPALFFTCLIEMRITLRCFCSPITSTKDPLMNSNKTCANYNHSVALTMTATAFVDSLLCFFVGILISSELWNLFNYSLWYFISLLVWHDWLLNIVPCVCSVNAGLWIHQVQPFYVYPMNCPENLSRDPIFHVRPIAAYAYAMQVVLSMPEYQ